MLALANADRHRSSCPDIPVSCVYAGCNVRKPRKDIESHQTACSYKLLNCEQCNEVVEVRLYDEHKQKTCVNANVQCDRCTVIMLRKDVEKHKLNDCPNIEVNCPNACPEKMLRSAIPKRTYLIFYINK